MPLDPITTLIKALEAKNPAPSSVAGGGGQLAEAAKSIPSRTETHVADILDSPELRSFRTQYARGTVEAQAIDGVLDIFKAVLAARGLI